MDFHVERAENILPHGFLRHRVQLAVRHNMLALGPPTKMQSLQTVRATVRAEPWERIVSHHRGRDVCTSVNFVRNRMILS